MDHYSEVDTDPLELEQDPNTLDQDPNERGYTNDAAEALRNMSQMPSDTQDQIRRLLLNQESLLFVEKPSRWRNNLILILASVVGTIAFIILLFFHARINLNILVVMAVFPIALIGAGYSIYRGEQRFLVFTDSRVLFKPGWGDTTVISLDQVVSSRIRYNWLMLMPELEVKHELPASMAPRRSALSKDLKRIKADYIDSVQQLETYHRFLQTRIQTGRREEEEDL